ncbi:hypothetical protein LINPERHAP2_LOCUS38340 [Linum perenne]
MGSYPESILRVGARGGRSEQGDSYFSRTWLVKWKVKNAWFSFIRLGLLEMTLVYFILIFGWLGGLFDG